MNRFCNKTIKRKSFGEVKCLLFEWHQGEHSHRQAPEEPPLERQLQILQVAAENPEAHLWSCICTYSGGGWITWMVDAGLLTEEPQIGRYAGETVFSYGGFSWSSPAPFNRITDKGRELLAHHAP